MAANNQNYDGSPWVTSSPPAGSWRVPGFTGPPTPYRFKGNSRLPYAGVGVAERGWLGTEIGAGAGQAMTLSGWGGLLVKRDIRPAEGAYNWTPPGTRYTQTVPIAGLTGGLQEQGQLTLTGLQQYMAQQAATGGAPPGVPGPLAGG